MSYEVAQSVLDQLAIATEVFTAGYISINFILYTWKRLGEESNSVTIPQPPLALPEAQPALLPELQEKRVLETVPAVAYEEHSPAAAYQEPMPSFPEPEPAIAPEASEPAIAPETPEPAPFDADEEDLWPE